MTIFPLTDQQILQLDRDLLDFARGKRRLRAIARWVEVQDNAHDRQRVAAHIAQKFLERYLNPEQER